MDKISLLIDRKDKVYLLSVNVKSTMVHVNKKDVWLCFYSMVKDIDFSTKVSIAVTNAPCF